jgi:hypothetical protein
MKSWVCNVLYLIMGETSFKTLWPKITEVLMGGNCLSLLGELMWLYEEGEINWPYPTRRTVSGRGFGLL